MMWVRILGIIVIVGIAEYYFYQALKNGVSKKYHLKLFWGQVAWICVILLLIITLFFYQSHRWSNTFRVLLSVIAILEISKLFGSVFMILDDLRRLFNLLFVCCSTSNKKGFDVSSTKLSRSQFLSQLAGIFTVIPLVGFIYGLLRGAYKIKIHRVDLSFSELPEKFSGIKIIQISDLHLGSFFNTKFVERVVEVINDENPDIVFFTGDLVNNVVEEALPYKPILSKLTAEIGIYSVLGNHDYGDYVLWDSYEKKQENLRRLINFQRELGWDILLNENRIIERDGEKIAIIGVENWGGNLHFPRYGKLDQAYSGTEFVPFKILLTHDPSHWDLEVSKKYPDITLTLSGHTHGFQFGVEYKNIKFSPVQWVYRHWAGLYARESKQMYANKRLFTGKSKPTQYLYVNRGIGFIGYPGRLGIWPEITVIQLKKQV